MPSSCVLVAHQTLVAAPCSVVLKADTVLDRAMAARRSSSDIDRIKSVTTAPGWTENARTRCASPRASSATAKRAFAVFDWPYASHLSYARRSKCGSSKSAPARRWPPAAPSGRDGAAAAARLGLAVGEPLVVRAPLEVRIVEVDPGPEVPSRRKRDDARPERLAQRRQESRGELERAQVVGRELRLEAAAVPDEWSRHDPRVVHQDVEGAAGREESPGEGIGRGGS